MSEIIICAILISISGTVLYGLGVTVLDWKRTKSRFQEMYWFLHLYVMMIPLLFIGTVIAIMNISLSPGQVFLAVQTKYVRWIMCGLFVIWMLGMMIKFVQLFKESALYERVRGWLIPADEKTQRMADEFAGIMGMMRKPQIMLGRCLETPQVMKLKKTIIVLPKKMYTEEQLRSVLLHELTHCKHGDVWFRRGTVFLCVIFWFNPILQRVLKNLGKWDEYYCDYYVCKSELVDDETYVRVLMELANDGGMLQKRNDEYPSLRNEKTEEKLVERMRLIMGWRRVKKMNKLMVVVMVGVMCLIGMGTSYVSAATLNALNNWSLENSNLGYVEDLVEVNLVEYEMPGDKMELGNVIGADAEINAASSGSISVTLSDSTWQSGKFYASSGQTITVAISSSLPTNVTINAGIIEPDGTWRWVNGSGSFMHNFSLDQTGYYRVFVRNKITDSVTVFGTYSTYSVD